MNWKGERRTTTAAHKTWRLAVLQRDNFTCQLKLNGCTVKATQADHKHNVKSGGAEHDVNNGQAACTNCHKQKTQAESLQARRRRGPGTPPPGSASLP
ncbi:HNH endonuclease [Paenarthrobacter nitroguajacolicus]|uniref:HNH endonuclease n=1 Tax=Paenarthrobacter nitroguajacolicus TaxID=211146 RepID=UPI003D7C2703